MFETGIRQFNMAMSTLWGKRINPRTIEHLIADAVKTLEEFGSPGDDAQQLLEGPFVDPASRTVFQNRAIQRTARHLARFSPYYNKLFSSYNIDPAKLTVESMPTVPITTKRALVEQQEDFITTNSLPCVATPTTGTTGKPAEIWISRYEIELWPALSALSGLLRNEILPTDYFQLNISSRATAAVQQNLATCRLVGARTRMLGMIPADESIDSLLDKRDGQAPTLLNTYPSYLAELIHAAQRRGLKPSDFCLRHVSCGGEVFSTALMQAARQTFGPTRVIDVFGMTEVLPVSGRTCNLGHLHHDTTMGFVEVLDLETHRPVQPGELGTVVVTPYYPYRECMPVFRYDTRDVVRRLPDEPLTCDLSAMPATTSILSKADHLLRLPHQAVTARDLIEVIEAFPSHPYPARFRAQVVNNHIELELEENILRDITTQEIRGRFQEAGIDLHVTCGKTNRNHPSTFHLLRTDLTETTFTSTARRK